MKLAEALILRADHQKRIEQLKQRLYRNAKVQEGEIPGENPEELLTEIDQITADLLQLIQRINATNATTVLSDGQTISDAIATRDILSIKQKILRELATSAAITQERYTKSEVKFKSTVNVPDLQKQADALARKYRELDTLIQEANWLTELK